MNKLEQFYLKILFIYQKIYNLLKTFVRKLYKKAIFIWNLFLYMCVKCIYFSWSVNCMFSKELTNFLKQYEVKDEEYKEPNEKVIYLKGGSKKFATVELLIKK